VAWVGGSNIAGGCPGPRGGRGLSLSLFFLLSSFLTEDVVPTFCCYQWCFPPSLLIFTLSL
jgi:hypothetical protein